jgi:hypothetical protein
MKNGYRLFAIIASMIVIVTFTTNASAQQYKIRQVTSTMGMKSETTVYVKGKRKRTEGGYAGMSNNLVTIEQCDLQRTITLNDKKKLFFIQPFSKEAPDVINEDEKPSAKSKPVAAVAKPATQKGGVVTMWYNISDTGERKKMYGLTARHVWSTLKMKPSADACLKDSMVIKTDGWYIDLPAFTCPVWNTAATTGGYGAQDCIDRYVTRQSGKGKLGFPLIEKRIMIMGDGTKEQNDFETNLETLEFLTAPQDSLLFEVPSGYTLAKDLSELQDRGNFAALQEQITDKDIEEDKEGINPATPKKPGYLRIGVLEPTGARDLPASQLQAYLVNTLTTGKVEAVAVSSVEEAKRYGCELMLTSQFVQVKQASKVGGMLKVIRNADPSSASAYNIESRLLLSNVTDGSTRLEKNVSGKYEGTAEGAARKALEEGSLAMLKGLK